ASSRCRSVGAAVSAGGHPIPEDDPLGRARRQSIAASFATPLRDPGRCRVPGYDAPVRRPPSNRAGWITRGIVQSYERLHLLGVAHSVETWLEDGELVGGLYGVSLGGLFAGEVDVPRCTRRVEGRSPPSSTSWAPPPTRSSTCSGPHLTSSRWERWRSPARTTSNGSPSR
ncbi:MAG: hypothetical protein V9G12_00305, partial [Microthrixaceae bacterium]